MKTSTFSRLIPAASALLLAFACGSGGGVADGRDDSFGGAGAKADGEYSQCQLSEVLNFVNESNTTEHRLMRHGLKQNVSELIVAHRAGPDGDIGTRDDDIYDDLDELDAVDFVGPVVLDHLVAAILKRCEVDLETRPFIDEDTFDGFTGGGFTRDNVELEAAMHVSGTTGQMLHDILLSTDDNDRTIFSRIAKARIMEAFTYSYDIDEMPWDSDSHAVREGMPLLPLSIESGRYVPDDDGGERELDLGTDIMDDIYYDTFDYRLLRSEMLLRGRIRWDEPGLVRRLLIAAKFNPVVDDNGLKRAAKTDVRTEGGTHMGTLNTDVMSGTVAWTGSRTPIEPVAQLYLGLQEQRRLPDIGNHRDVLVLDPKIHLRSTRSRFHLDLVSTSTMRSFYDHGRQQIRNIIATAEAALASGTLSPADASAIQAVVDKGRSIDDGSLIADRARSALLAIDPGMNVTVGNLSFPDELSSTAGSFEELEKNRVVAETVSEVFHEWAEEVDDIDRPLTGTDDLPFDDYVDMFVEWRQAEDASLLIIRTHAAFLGEYQAIDAAGNLQDRWDDFNAFGMAEQADGDGDFEDFEPMTPEIWEALGRHLEFEVNKEAQRQVEAAGSMGLALWFDQAREFYVPASNRPFGNFMIDTMDMAEMVTRDEWLSIPEADREIDVPLDPAKVFTTTLVNEVQIELGNEEPYVERIEELKARIDDGSASDTDRRNLDGTRFVFDTMIDAILYLSAIKGDDLLDRLEDEGAPSTVSWEPSELSKGTLGLQILGDMD